MCLCDEKKKAIECTLYGKNGETRSLKLFSFIFNLGTFSTFKNSIYLATKIHCMICDFNHIYLNQIHGINNIKIVQPK